MRHLTLVVAVVAVGLAGCRNDSPVQPKQPQGLQALISDGAHSGGNKDFFFLPPLVSNPVGSANYDAGKFNAHVSPTVEVCELTAVDVASLLTATCASDARVFGPTPMTLDATNEQYQLNWDTKTSSLIATSFYRIIVRGVARGTVLGTLDIDPVLGGMKNAKTGDVYVFQDGRTLPIKVRIEQGAFGSTNPDDHVEQVVPAVLPAGGLDVTTNTGTAGVHFPQNSLPEGIDQLVVIIDRVPVDESNGATCLSSGLKELEGCYRFRTDPDLHSLETQFHLPVTVGICFEVPNTVGDPNNHYPYVLHQREEVNNVLVGPARPLPEARADFLRCADFHATPPQIGAALRAGRLGDIAMAGLSALGRLLEPRALHAVDFGAGGSTSEFSRFGWAERDTMMAGANMPSSGQAGSTIQATVHIQALHDNNPPVAGRDVTFSVTGPNGTLVDGNGNETNSVTTPTNSQGDATVQWRLGVGPNALTAAAESVANSPITLNATGTVVSLSGYEVVTAGPFALAASTGFVRDVASCSANKVVFGGGTQVISEGVQDFNTRMQESAPGIVNANDNVWLVSIDNVSASAHNVDLFATCASAPPGYEVVTTDAVVPAGGFTRSAPQCPAGKVVYGGGEQVATEGIGDFDTRLQESAPGTVGRSTSVWLSSVRNESASQHTVRLFAVCAYPIAGYEVVSGSVTSLAAGSGFNRAAVQCPAGKVVLGGGAQVAGEGSANFNTRLQESAPGTVGLSNETSVWLVSMKNLDAVAHDVRFFAVCGSTA